MTHEELKKLSSEAVFKYQEDDYVAYGFIKMHNGILSFSSFYLTCGDTHEKNYTWTINQTDVYSIASQEEAMLKMLESQ